MRSVHLARRALPVACMLIVAGFAPASAADHPTQRFTLGHGLSVTAPARGYGIAASAVTTSGEDLDLVLETGADGITRDVTGQEGSRAATPAVASAAASPAAASTGISLMSSKPACQDGAYHLLPLKWFRAWNWWFASPTTPSEIRRAAAESRLRSAVASITGERNDCGRPDTVSATSKYRGRTHLKPGIDNQCRTQDGKSVVGFGDLPPGVLGLTCTTFAVGDGGRPGPAVESDVVFNKDDFQWSTSLATCQPQQAMLRSVATHEFGHVFGLNHVDEANHGNLTMSEAIGPCDNSAFTLGLGDMRGLEKRY